LRVERLRKSDSFTTGAWFGLIGAHETGRTCVALFAVICLHAVGCATSTVSEPAAGLGVDPTGQWLRMELYMAVVDVERWREFKAQCNQVSVLRATTPAQVAF
jgi:hypothetical protein